MSDPKNFTIPAEIIDQITKQIDTPSPEACKAFMGDAIDTYIYLVTLAAQGAEFWVSEAKNDDFTKLLFPFAIPDQNDR